MDPIKLNELIGKNDDDMTFDVVPVERRVSLRRSSLFGLENQKSSSPPAKASKTAYEQTLLTECRQWDALVKDSFKHNASIADKPLSVTMADLTIGQRNYFNAVPDFRKFQADGVRFAKRATMYLQMMEDFEQRKAAINERVRSELLVANIGLVRQL